MPYALRDENGEIVALTALPNAENDVPLGLDSPEVLRFLTRLGDGQDAAHNGELLARDLQQIRILEDLIDLLTLKGIIRFSDLPVPAQEKILSKKTRRENLVQGNDILVESDIPLL
ncbi:MAG: hypothetical protein LBK01_00750 [Burkholderiaceae bacterium]|nr:hypothetical protein [Burkholderiaceae bacterium]